MKIAKIIQWDNLIYTDVCINWGEPPYDPVEGEKVGDICLPIVEGIEGTVHEGAVR